ncbi:MAG: hypothetical protein KAK01_05800 [Candidatus Marinimicrobia bacterium]|nr:hypothetical protein [Candidatus Neomarinimicrobiota bacterium]
MTIPTFLLLNGMEQLFQTIKDLLAAEEAVVLEVRGDGINSPIKVVIDSEIPVSMEMVTHITRLIRDAEEMERLFPDGFQLEVTSPGIDAPLEHPFQYRKNVNRTIKLKLNEDQDLEELKAKLTRVEEAGIFISRKSNSDEYIPFEQIIQANLIISFKG